MIGLLYFFMAVLASPFKSKLRLEAENAVLRHQLIVFRRRLHGRVQLTNHDRWFFVQLYRWFPSILQAFAIIRPETLLRWHRAGFRRCWRWKSRPLGGRPPTDMELRVLIRRISVEKPRRRARPSTTATVKTLVNPRKRRQLRPRGSRHANHSFRRLADRQGLQAIRREGRDACDRRVSSMREGST